VHQASYAEVRELENLATTPTRSIVDSRSVKGAEKEGLYRSVWVRCRQKDQRQEKPYSRGCARPDARPGEHVGQHSASRYDRANNEDRQTGVPVHRARHGYWLLPRRSNSSRSFKCCRYSTRHRQAIPHIWLARSLPPPRQGFRKSRAFSRCLRHSGHDPPDGATHCKAAAFAAINPGRTLRDREIY
jgi:hypothetical protein